MTYSNDLLSLLKSSPQAHTLKEPFCIVLQLAYVCSLLFSKGGFLCQCNILSHLLYVLHFLPSMIDLN